MAKSLEQRLEDLQAKRDSLDAQIKAIRKEKVVELRKERDRRERLVGKALYARIEAGDWSHTDLLTMMDAFLTRAVDRQLFGLDIEEHKPADAATKKQRRSSSRFTAADNGKAEVSGKPTTPRTLPQPATQDKALSEFNL